MSDKSDTPRTDANEIDEAYFADWGIGPSGYVRADDMRQLERELTAALKDAERYRWLRDGEAKTEMKDFPIAKGYATLNSLWDKELDEAIDAAIAAEKPPPVA